MKKLLAIALCLIMVAAIAVSTISADDTKLIDMRELEQYGQLHFYLDKIEPSKKPTVTDAKVSEGEYSTVYEYSPKSDSKIVAMSDSKTGNYTDTEWVKLYMSNDGEYLYIAVETKDKVFSVKDEIYINIGARDGGRTIEGVTRCRYDFYGDTSNGILVNDDVKTRANPGWKNDDGSWGTPNPVTFNDHVGDRSLGYDKTTQIATLEVAFKIQPILDYWNNTNDIEDARLYLFLIHLMRGDSGEGKNDGPTNEQGYLWFYFNALSDPSIKMNFILDYPECSYWMDWEPYIVHFCEKPAETTVAPTTTAEPTTAAPTTTKAATTKTVTAVAATTDAPTVTTAEATAVATTKGCKSTVALTALALVPMLGAAVVFGKKKED